MDIPSNTGPTPDTPRLHDAFRRLREGLSSEIVGQAARLGLNVGITPDDLVGPQFGAVVGRAPQEEEWQRGEPVVGDQIEWNGTIWTVAVMEGNKILKVGIKFPEGSRPGPGLFL